MVPELVRHTLKPLTICIDKLQIHQAVEHPSTAALHQLKELLQGEPAFAQALRATASTEAAAQLAAEHGVQVSPEALWRHRGTLASGGLPTWRG